MLLTFRAILLHQIINRPQSNLLLQSLIDGRRIIPGGQQRYYTLSSTDAQSGHISNIFMHPLYSSSLGQQLLWLKLFIGRAAVRLLKI